MGYYSVEDMVSVSSQCELSMLIDGYLDFIDSGALKVSKNYARLQEVREVSEVLQGKSEIIGDDTVSCICRFIGWFRQGPGRDDAIRKEVKALHSKVRQRRLRRNRSIGNELVIPEDLISEFERVEESFRLKLLGNWDNSKSSVRTRSSEKTPRDDFEEFDYMEGSDPRVDEKPNSKEVNQKTDDSIKFLISDELRQELDTISRIIDQCNAPLVSSKSPDFSDEQILLYALRILRREINAQTKKQLR